MRNPTPDFFYRKILANSKCSQRARLDALSALEHPPLAVLARILRDPSTPQRLIRACADAYALETLCRKHAPQQQETE